MRAFLLVLILTVGALAQPPLRVVKSKTFAPSEIVKPICVEVEFTNDGQNPIVGAELVLRMVPQYRTAYEAPVPTEGYLAPQEMRFPVEPLKPGQRTSAMFQTPYFARSAFSSSKSSFLVENIVPGLCESVTVRYVILIVPPPDGWEP